MSDAIGKALEQRLLENQQKLRQELGINVPVDSQGNEMNLGTALDSVTGAPFRSAVGQMQEGNFGEALRAYKEQFANDPSLAPTMEDIAIKAGVPEGAWSKAAGVVGSFAEPGIPMVKGSVKGYKLPQIKPGEAKIVSSPAYRESFEQALQEMKSKPPMKANVVKPGSIDYKPIATEAQDLHAQLDNLKSMRQRVADQLNSNKENFNNKKIIAQHDNLNEQIKALEAKIKGGK